MIMTLKWQQSNPEDEAGAPAEGAGEDEALASKGPSHNKRNRVASQLEELINLKKDIQIIHRRIHAPCTGNMESQPITVHFL